MVRTITAGVTPFAKIVKRIQRFLQPGKPGLPALLCICMLTGLRSAGEGISLSALYSDNMLIQAGQAFVISGSSDPNTDVTVQVLDKIKKSRVDQYGKWMVRFASLPPNSRFDITITGIGNERKLIRNVITGELWLCSGQSNMGMTVASTDVKRKMENAAVQDIRYFIAQNDPAAVPTEQLKGHWVICSPGNFSECSAVALSFAWHLHQAIQMPVGLVINAVGGTPIESWTKLELVKKKDFNNQIFEERAQWKRDRPMYEEQFAQKLAAWELAVKQAQEKGLPQPAKIYPPFQLRDNWDPGSLYNSLIYPLHGIALKGVVWYQGESNASHAFVYRYQLADMIRNWRGLFNNPDLPFYIIQLPEYQSADNWPVLRESQAVAALLQNTHLVVTLGLGDSLNIHPVRKMEVGRRVALQVLNSEYRQKQVATGPVFKTMKREGNRIRLTFDCSGSAVQSSDAQPLRNMEIAGDDSLFLPAQCVINGNTLVVWNDNIRRPRNVRYAWKNVPEPVNFTNREGLPAPPFFCRGTK